MLDRAMPLLQLEKFGQTYVLPTNSTQTAKFRRYYLVRVPLARRVTARARSASRLRSVPLVEGVTPSGSTLANTDYSVQVVAVR
jgi:hypothetical protein